MANPITTVKDNSTLILLGIGAVVGFFAIKKFKMGFDIIDKEVLEPAREATANFIFSAGTLVGVFDTEKQAFITNTLASPKIRERFNDPFFISKAAAEAPRLLRDMLDAFPGYRVFLRDNFPEEYQKAIRLESTFS